MVSAVSPSVRIRAVGANLEAAARNGSNAIDGTESNPDSGKDKKRPVASRMGRVARMLGSGYLSLAAASVYVLVSVPLALRFLSLSEFGLWAIMVQVSGYLALVDMGMTNSTARFPLITRITGRWGVRERAPDRGNNWRYAFRH